MKTLCVVAGICLMVGVCGALCADTKDVHTSPTLRSSIPYVVTHSDTVQDMLWMAKVGKGDVVYDLGSGDGRIVITAVRNFDARQAVGIEIAPDLIRQSRKNAQDEGVADRAEFIQGDLFTSDFGQATVVTLFLGHDPNIKLRPQMFDTLKPGTRIVSHQYGMGEWQANKTLTVQRTYQGMYGTMANPYSTNPRVPDYTGNESDPFTNDKILMWVTPAPVAGIWRGKIAVGGGARECRLMLHQRLSTVTGTFELSEQPNSTMGVKVELWGTHLRFFCERKDLQIRFDGYIHGDSLKGAMSVMENGRSQEGGWEARREKVDYSGAWEWPCATGPRSVTLRIERNNDQFLVTYSDRDKTIPVTDFYDHGGGFYFTLMIGRDKDGTVITDDPGWLIGGGILSNGTLQGSIEFYPYIDKPVVRAAWHPQRKID